MLRVVCFLTLASAAAVAFRPAVPADFDDRPFPVNSTVARFFLPEWRDWPSALEVPAEESADSVASPGILLFQYSAYDSTYSQKIQKLVQRKFPYCDLSTFDDGGPDALTAALKDRSAVVISYPSAGNSAQLKTYGNVLKRFVQQGGVVIVTGTHEYTILQQLGLFDLDYGYFCADPSVHISSATGNAYQQTLMAGVPSEFSLTDYAYPLDISDSAFVTIADVRGYPVAGYKPLGKGKIVYLGLEYYRDEPAPTTMLLNVLRAANKAYTNRYQTRYLRRQPEILVAGSGSKAPQVALSLYPNPYVEKATLEIELDFPNTVYVEMTDQTGRSVALLLPQKNLNAGLYRIEVPNVPAGVYYVKCEVGGEQITKTIMKTQAQ